MQFIGRDADRVRDFLDFRLRAPALGNIGDRAAHDGIVIVGGLKRRRIGQAVGGQHGGLQRHIRCLLVRFVRDREPPDFWPHKGVLVGPRFASPIAAESALPKLSRSPGARNPPTVSFLPRDTRNSRIRPYSSCVSRSRLVHTGLSDHSWTLPRWLTFFTRSSDGVTVTSSYAAAAR